jgi:hypothetical protein
MILFWQFLSVPFEIAFEKTDDEGWLASTKDEGPSGNFGPMGNSLFSPQIVDALNGSTGFFPSF